jgi:hypothetical protein
MRLITLLVMVWLVIGAAAAAQRHYFTGPVTGCSQLKTIAETIGAGPLNYMGVDPKASCRMPQPSK